MTGRVLSLLQSSDITPARAFARAAECHAQGKLREAEQLYDIVLAADARHFESAFRLGLIRLIQGRFADAESLFRRAVKLDKRSADAHHHLAIALTGLQRLEEAIQRYVKTLELRPKYAEAHNNFGHALQLLDRHAEAAEHYRKALAINPSYAEARNNLGNALQALDRTEEALAQYQQAIALNPAYAEAHNNLAGALMALDRYEEALVPCEKAIGLRPNYSEAHMNLANALAALDRLEEAVTHYRKALAFDPANAVAHIRLGHALFLLGRTAEATVHCDQALAIEPQKHQGWHDLGLLLWKLKRPEEALASNNRALAIEPDFVPALVNRSNVLMELRCFEEALTGYARAEAIEPDNAEVHFGEGMLRLRLGDFRRGLEKYEWRRKSRDKAYLEGDFEKPIWLGTEDIAGKTILIHAEQGLGDTLQFCRYAEMVAEKGARVVLEVQPTLKSLLQSLKGIETIIAQGEVRPDFDFHCPLVSLMFAFKTAFETIPAKTPYLQSSPDLVLKWDQRLGPKEKPRVGLVWSGNPNQMNDHNRSMPLSDCLPLFLPNIQLVSLQKEVRPRDLDLLHAHRDLMQFGEELRDFSDTAALACLMDLVISVCTSVGHAAAALNRPTWFMLSHAADWRWFLERKDCPWYPSARLFRQPKLGDWASVIQEVAGELAAKFR